MSNLQIAEQMIAHYNAQDADAYVALMTEHACEANYLGAVLREGREGVCTGLYPFFDCPELVEGLHFSSCLPRHLKKKISPSTSSGWSGLGGEGAHNG